MPPARRRAPALTWDQVQLAPVVLLRGAEPVLADRAVERLRAQATEADPDTEVTVLEAAAYDRGVLEMVASPSLFGEPRFVVVNGAEAMTEAFGEDALAYLATAPADVTLVIRHNGGQRGKKLLDAVPAAGFPVVACDPIKRDDDKAAFVVADLRRARRRYETDAVQALVDAVGSDLRELAAATSQLLADTTGTITRDVVARYYGGRVEATGFTVADAAVAGRSGEAVALLRHAIATGTGPVPVVAALALKLRTMAKVAAIRGRSGYDVASLGLASWQVDRARRDLRGWTPEGLAAAITATAAADAEVKGLSRDPVFAVERAVLRVAAARRGAA